jgi:hypothetical protein
MGSVNMTLKEASMSRYREWAEYKKRSWRLLPPVLEAVAGKPESGGNPS